MKNNTGRIELICGSMFSGKTEELIRRINRAIIARQTVSVFNHSIDVRYLSDHIASHNGLKHKCLSVPYSKDILDRIAPGTTVAAIDEAQFFDEGLVSVVHQLASEGIRVIIAGLKTDFKGEPFGPMADLISGQLEDITPLTAICVVCGEPAICTQRIINGKPANYHSEVILVGADESYEARCRKHWVVPGHPIEAFATSEFLEAGALLPERHVHSAH